MVTYSYPQLPHVFGKLFNLKPFKAMVKIGPMYHQNKKKVITTSQHLQMANNEFNHFNGYIWLLAVTPIL